MGAGCMGWSFRFAFVSASDVEKTGLHIYSDYFVLLDAISFSFLYKVVILDV